MKRLLILSLLMIQGVWGAGAAQGGVSAQQQEEGKKVIVETSDEIKIECQYSYPGWSNTLNYLLEALPGSDEAIPVSVTGTAFNLVQDLCLQLEKNNGLFSDVPSWLLQDSEEIYELLRAANYLDPQDGFETFIKALYVAWLNADVTRAIVVSQNLVQACQQMGINNFPVEWVQLIIDVSDVLDANGIESLDRRSNSISWLVYTNQMPAVVNRRLNLSNRNLTVCDAWNIPNAGTLRELHLYNNQLTILAPGTFAGLGALRDLHLNGNQLTTLADRTFAGLGNLRQLHLNNNRLTTLADGTFVGLGVLTHLYLYNNQLETLAPGTFVGLGVLTHLHLNNNQLTTLAPGTFAGLGALTDLYLHNNQLTTLAPGTFAGLKKLTGLFLHDNQLTTLADGTFVELENLVALYLDTNKLTTLTSGVFAGLGKLKGLYLNKNELRTIADGTFAGLVELETLALQGNSALKGVETNKLTSIKKKHKNWFTSNQDTGSASKRFNPLYWFRK